MECIGKDERILKILRSHTLCEATPMKKCVFYEDLLR
jgi:hypothetical protein